jgi:hypothetical protein
VEARMGARVKSRLKPRLGWCRESDVQGNILRRVDLPCGNQ